MAMYPGRNFINSNFRLTVNFQNSDEVDVDPEVVVCKVMSPTGVQTTYTYGEDDELGQLDTGDFYLDFVPDESGRWYFRWESSDDGTVYDIAEEGNFIIQYSAFYDGITRAYGR